MPASIHTRHLHIKRQPGEPVEPANRDGRKASIVEARPMVHAWRAIKLVGDPADILTTTAGTACCPPTAKRQYATSHNRRAGLARHHRHTSTARAWIFENIVGVYEKNLPLEFE